MMSYLLKFVKSLIDLNKKLYCSTTTMDLNITVYFYHENKILEND